MNKSEAMLQVSCSLDGIAEKLSTVRAAGEVNVTDAICEIGFQLECIATAFVRIADVMEEDSRTRPL